MPLYEYECQACGHRGEELQRFEDPPLTTCPACGGPYKKLISAPAFQFKGSGWYVTDYARKEAKGKEAGGEKGEGAKSEKGEKGEKKEATASSSSGPDKGGSEKGGKGAAGKE